MMAFWWLACVPTERKKARIEKTMDEVVVSDDNFNKRVAALSCDKGVFEQVESVKAVQTGKIARRAGTPTLSEQLIEWKKAHEVQHVPT